MILENTKKQFNIIEENQPVNSSFEKTLLSVAKEENNIELTAEKKQIIIEPEEKVINLILEEKVTSIEVGTGNEGASSGNATQIQGVPVSNNLPGENQILIYDGEQYIPKFYSKQVFVAVTVSDKFNGYMVINNPAAGSSGEKAYIELTPEGFPQQIYGKDFTAINVKNTYLVIIWKTSGEISGIENPAYPSEGMTDIIDTGDILKINYHF